MQTIKRQPRANRDERTTHRSLERGLRILEAVASNDGTTTLAEMVRRTGLHRSTAHHLLQTLVDLDYLHQDPGTRRYELSAKLFRLTRRTWTPEQLGEIAQPFLAGLTARTGEGSSLAAYRDGIVTIVAKCDPDGPVRVIQNLGSQRPIHATAVGKAIVAWLPQPVLGGVLRRVRFDRYTPKTITSRSGLDAELRRIQAAGFAIDDEEHMEGIRCVAAPVFGYTGQVLGSLCALGPKSRMSHQRLRQLRVPLLERARALSERLGWRADDAPAEDAA
jgi:DNA-binding IclR family transcriptional regulator